MQLAPFADVCIDSPGPAGQLIKAIGIGIDEITAGICLDTPRPIDGVTVIPSSSSSAEPPYKPTAQMLTPTEIPTETETVPHPPAPLGRYLFASSLKKAHCASRIPARQRKVRPIPPQRNRTTLGVNLGSDGLPGVNDDIKS